MARCPPLSSLRVIMRRRKFTSVPCFVLPVTSHSRSTGFENDAYPPRSLGENFTDPGLISVSVSLISEETQIWPACVIRLSSKNPRHPNVRKVRTSGATLRRCSSVSRSPSKAHDPIHSHPPRTPGEKFTDPELMSVWVSVMGEEIFDDRHCAELAHRAKAAFPLGMILLPNDDAGQ